MNPERLTLLNAKTQSFSDTGGSFGSMTVSDLCACMAGCKPIGELIIRRRYINHKERGTGFLRLLKDSIYKIYEKDKQPKKNGMIEPLLELALDDYLQVNLCKLCNGTGEVLTLGIAKPCRSTLCTDGKRSRKDHEKARILGMKPLDYSRNCKPAYVIIENHLTKILPEAESEALRHINKRSQWND